MADSHTSKDSNGQPEDLPAPKKKLKLAIKKPAKEGSPEPDSIPLKKATPESQNPPKPSIKLPSPAEAKKSIAQEKVKQPILDPIIEADSIPPAEKAVPQTAEPNKKILNIKPPVPSGSSSPKPLQPMVESPEPNHILSNDEQDESTSSEKISAEDALRELGSIEEKPSERIPLLESEKTKSKKKKLKLPLKALLIPILGSAAWLTYSHFNDDGEKPESVTEKADSQKVTDKIQQTVPSAEIEQTSPITENEAISVPAAPIPLEATQENAAVREIINDLRISIVKTAGENKGLYIGGTFYPTGSEWGEDLKIKLLEVRGNSREIVFEDPEGITYILLY